MVGRGVSLRLAAALRHPFPGAGSTQAGSAGAAGEDGGGGGGRSLARTPVLEQNVNAAFAPCFSGYHYRRLALAVFCFHVDSILRREERKNTTINPVSVFNSTVQWEIHNETLFSIRFLLNFIT